jgi:ATP/maltotriose-dependent transcriptional regulator MalT
MSPEPRGDAGKPPFLQALFAENRAELALAAGDVEEARGQSAMARETGAALASPMSWLLADLDGDTAQALALMDAAMCAPATARQVALAGVAAADKVRLQLREGDRAGAGLSIREAVRRLAPQGLVYPLWRAGANCPEYFDLLSELAASSPSPEFIGDALAALLRPRPHDDDPSFRSSGVIDLRSRAAAASQAGAPSVTSVGRSHEPLSARETDVLRELALGGSYRDIGQSLYVTENTVKTHVASLYRKLGADRRSAALRTARDAGLI